MEYCDVHYIYCLVCPDSKDVKYIGRTNDAYARYASHISWGKSNRRYDNAKLFDWMNPLINNGKKPVLKILKACPKEKAKFYEKLYFNVYNKNSELLNAQSLHDKTVFNFERLISLKRKHKKTSKEISIATGLSRGVIYFFHTKQIEKIGFYSIQKISFYLEGLEI